MKVLRIIGGAPVKRALTIFGVALLAAAVFVACAQKPASTAQPAAQQASQTQAATSE